MDDSENSLMPLTDIEPFRVSLKLKAARGGEHMCFQPLRNEPVGWAVSLGSGLPLATGTARGDAVGSAPRRPCGQGGRSTHLHKGQHVRLQA